MTTERTDFRALPVDVSGEGTVNNERRFRAAIEKAFATTDDGVRALSIALKNLNEGDITDLDRVRWRNRWLQQEYVENDMVLDGAWTMIANKTTTDQAAPQEDGNPQWSLDDQPLWAYNQFVGTVESGAVYNVTEPVTLQSYQVWLPNVSSTVTYVIRTFSYPTDEPERITYQDVTPSLVVEDNWGTVAAPQNLITSGTTVGILVNALNSGSTTQVGPFDWGRGASSNATPPIAGEWNQSNNGSTLRINWVDADAINRQADLTGVIAGSLISIVNKSDATESVSFRTTTGESTNGSSYEWSVTFEEEGTGGQPPVGETCVITITVPLPSATDYVQLAGGNVPYPNITGFLTLDGVEQVVPDDAFGVRILFDTWTLSEDWDIVSVVGTGGGGGSSGASSFTDLTDTPSSYSGQGGKSVAVKADGSGLEFKEGQVFHDPAGLGSWRLIGDTLECWGVALGASSGDRAVVFPKTYAAIPVVNTTASSSSNNTRSTHAANITTTGFTARVRDQNGDASNNNTGWHAIGQWDGTL